MAGTAGCESSGLVQLVCSPIGNLGDITYRAVDSLKSADIVACEDTRHSRKLFSHYDIRPSELIALHEHNEKSRSIDLAERLRQSNETLALVSDAGAPSISDPGFPLVQECIKVGVKVEVLPGPSAVMTGLIGSGLPTSQFQFLGFLPPKSGRRQKMIEKALAADLTTIFFESPHRIERTLEVIASIEPQRLICVARELTKKFECFHSGCAPELLTTMRQNDALRGEITLILSGVTRAETKREKVNKYPKSTNNSD